MQVQLKPWSKNEHLYFYLQSQQLSGQTGQIGKLRADFDKNVTGFFTSWDDIRGDLKTPEFKSEFDEIINGLRFSSDSSPFANRKALTNFIREHADAKLPDDGEWNGFRADTKNYSYFFRVKPSPGDYDIYCWCYKKDWLDSHMANAEKGVRFISTNYEDKFRLPDGGKFKVTYPDGSPAEDICRYIDEAHLELNGGRGAFSLQHICEYAERLEKAGAKIEPITEPLTVLHARYYCPLKVDVFERNEYGDLEDNGYEMDGRYAAQYEGEIRELLEKMHSYNGCDPKSMATYQDNRKIRAVEWDVTDIRGTLYGVMQVDLAAPLTASEERDFRDWLSGQNSDGFGEGLEQRKIQVDEGEAYVSFWNSDDGYYIKNEIEFWQSLLEQNNGGMRL